jgi:hypothetical protein
MLDILSLNLKFLKSNVLIYKKTLKCIVYTIKFKVICHLLLKNVTILSVHEPNPNTNKTQQWNVT